ncbi:MAG: adenylate/guanylate cyclase domain-containing protein [Chloroflexi bacterium]|nr:MAG: adenylate/guanylate cyclase domain-containing protein [Chloroflexota bacterium]
MQAGVRLRPEGQEYIGFARNKGTMSPARARTAVDTAEGAIVFTDLAGFTEFTAIQGDEAALDLLGVQDQVVGELIEGRGRVVKELGDGLMLWFDDPCHAIETALELQERFDEQSAKENLPLWVRIGVHYGRPAKRGSDLVGHDVNVAARVADLAAPGEVLISEAAAERVAERMEGVWFEEMGPTVMKGIPEPVGIYRCVRAG